MKKPRTTNFIIPAFIIAVLLLSGCTQSGTFAISSGEVPIDLTAKYPTYDDRLVVPKLGSLECRYTGGNTAYSQVTSFFKVTDGQYAKILECPANSGSQGCEFKLDAGSAKTVFGGSTSASHIFRTGNSASTMTVATYTTSLRLSAGQSLRVDLQCSGIGCSYTTQPSASFRESERKIKVTGDCGYNGWLPGSNNCQLVSTELDKLKKMQETNEPLDLTAGQIAFGETQSFVACWDDLPVFGNVNPLGRYNNQDVFCSPQQGLYQVEIAQTVGGKRYFMQGSQLLSKTTTNSLCCSNSDCGGSSTCENYKCVAKPVSCGSAGSCNVIQNGQVISKDKEVTKNGKFYLQTDTCTNGCIDRVEKEVSCTKSYCDKQSTPTNSLYCDYNSGCVEINVKQACPAGSCCDTGGKWQPQLCTTGNVCCKSSTSSDPFIGTCQTTCDTQPTCTQPSDCNEGQICVNGMCKNAEACTDKLAGLVPGTLTQISKCGLACKAGLANPTLETGCDYDWTAVWFFFIALVIIVGGLGLTAYYVRKG